MRLTNKRITKLGSSLKPMLSQMKPGRRFSGALLVASIILINLLVARFGLVSFDLTKDQRYSLSPPAKEILSQLPDQVTVKVYISSNIPAKFNPVKNYVLTTLLNMQRQSRQRLRVEVYDPDKDPDKAQEARDYQLPQADFSVIEKDQFQVKRGYFGLVILFTDRSETIPFFGQIDSFEYEFIRRLLKLTASTEPKLYLSTGSGEDWQSANTFYQELGKSYNLVRLDLATDNLTEVVDNKTQAILVYNPQNKIDDKVVSQLKAWWQTGGKNVILFLDGMTMDDKFQPRFNFDKYSKLLSLFNLKMKPQLVLSRQGEVIPMQANNLPFPVFRYYGFWLKATIKDVNQDLAWYKDLVGTVWPWTAALTYPIDNKDYRSIIEFKGVNLIDCPCSLQPEAVGFDPKQAKTVTTGLIYLPETDKEGKFIAVADADFVSDNMLNRYPQNLKAALDSVDQLAFDERLARLRSRIVKDRSLKPINQAQKQRFKLAFLLSPVGMIIALAGLSILATKLFKKRLQIFS